MQLAKDNCPFSKKVPTTLKDPNLGSFSVDLYDMRRTKFPLGEPTIKPSDAHPYLFERYLASRSGTSGQKRRARVPSSGIKFHFAFNIA
jgi:hypothetical protein